MTAIIFVGSGELMGYSGEIQVAQKKVKIAFENAGSSSRVELIPSKIKYAKKVILNFHKEFLVFLSLSRKGNDGLLQDQVFKNKEEVIIKKSDEFINSSVENLVPNPSESEGENGCDVPACFTTFSNVLFDDNYEFDASDNQSCSDEDHHHNAEFDLIESLLNHDSSIIPFSSKIDSLFDEFGSELTLLKSIPLGIDETNCYHENDIRFTKRLLYDNSSPRPSKEFVSENSNADIESFSPSHIPVEDSDSRMEEIDLTFTPDDPMTPGIKEDDDDSERDILIRKELLDNYSLLFPLIESYHYDIPSFSRPPAKPPDGNTGLLNIKMMGDISEQKVPIPGLMITLVSNQEKSSDLLCHRGLETFQPSAKCPMMIYGKNIPILDVPLFPFYPP
nr:hypothetical protein [Tanacetum cinerariifolium]